jgi:broad specificity phosphatase PhoE
MKNIDDELRAQDPEFDNLSDDEKAEARAAYAGEEAPKPKQGSGLRNPEMPDFPGQQPGEVDERFEGRSPNHSFYNKPAPPAPKVYPKPGEGSSGTGEFPPKYIDTVGIYKQREEQKENTEEPEY